MNPQTCLQLLLINQALTLKHPDQNRHAAGNSLNAAGQFIKILRGHHYDSGCQFTAKDCTGSNPFAHMQSRRLFGKVSSGGLPMSRRRWKGMRPTSLRHALELCKDYARETHNKGVERIADEMGLPDHWALYKWLQSGRMPANLIRPYEQACRCDYVTRWIAASAGRLTIDMPTGRHCSAQDMHVLQELLNTAAGKLLAFYAEHQEADETLAAIQAAMEGLAWHKGNVSQSDQPQLELEGQP